MLQSPAELSAGSSQRGPSSLRNFTKESLFGWGQGVCEATKGSQLTYLGQSITTRSRREGSRPRGSLTQKEARRRKKARMLRITWKVSWVLDLLETSRAELGLRSRLGSCANGSSSSRSGKTPYNERALAAAKFWLSRTQHRAGLRFSQDPRSQLWVCSCSAQPGLVVPAGYCPSTRQRSVHVITETKGSSWFC